MMTAVLAEVTDSALGSELGIVIDGTEAGRVTAHMLVKPEYLNSAHRAHGGILMAFADEVAAYATTRLLPDGCATTTIESKTNFLKFTQVGRIRAEAVALHTGRSTMVWQTTIRNDADQVLAVTTQTQLLMQGAKPEPAGDAAEPAGPDGEPDADGPADQNHPRAGSRRRQILDGAFKVISKKGFARASMREIAGAAGVSVPTLYQYVDSKDELLEQIFDDYLGQVQAKVNLSGLSLPTAAEKLRAAIGVTLTEFDRFQSQIRLMNRETRSAAPETRRRIKEHLLHYIGSFRDIIEGGIASGEFREVNADIYANFIPMLCEIWPLRLWAVGSYGVEEVQRGITDMALMALRAPAPAAR